MTDDTLNASLVRYDDESADAYGIDSMFLDEDDLDEFDDDEHALLTPRWSPMIDHATQQSYVFSPHRFNTLPCGRRSGKTELLKRKLVMRAIAGSEYDDPRYFAAAPTLQQAIRIFWQDFKRLIPRGLIHKISETSHAITLITGAELWVVGLDAPERIEGSPWDGCGITEFANVKPIAWAENVYPALSDRAGWADLEGVPEGRNHYYDIDQNAKQQQAELGAKSMWGSFHWTSEEVMPLYGRGDQLEQARKDLDELTYEQEYRASFVAFRGMAYYNFNAQSQRAVAQYYDESAPLILAFDFNIAPGVCAIMQEVEIRGNEKTEQFTAVIGEVWIKRDSTTPRVCDAVIESRFGNHQGTIHCHGDATGGAGGTASVDGSDWELIQGKFNNHFGANRMRYDYPAANPREKVRVNSVNARIKNQLGERFLYVDPAHCPHIVRDFEGVQRNDDGSLKKASGSELSHISDAIGYYIVEKYPVIEGRRASTSDFDFA